MELRSAKMKRIIEICSNGPVRFSDLKRQLSITSAGLAGNLQRLESGGLLARTENGYLLTDKGKEFLRGLTLAEEMRKQKLVKRLLILQELVHPREILSFGSLRALVSQEPLTPERYEALSVTEALEVTSDQEFDPNAIVKVYANTLKLLRNIITPDKPAARLSIAFDLRKGFDLARQQLEKELKEEKDENKKRKLQKILNKMEGQRDNMIKDAVKRFVK